MLGTILYYYCFVFLLIYKCFIISISFNKYLSLFWYKSLFFIFSYHAWTISPLWFIVYNSVLTINYSINNNTLTCVRIKIIIKIPTEH